MDLPSLFYFLRLMDTAPKIIRLMPTIFNADTDSPKTKIPKTVTNTVPKPAKTAFTAPTSRLAVNNI